MIARHAAGTAMLQFGARRVALHPCRLVSSKKVVDGKSRRHAEITESKGRDILNDAVFNKVTPKSTKCVNMDSIELLISWP